MVIRMLVVMCTSCPDLAVVLLKQSKKHYTHVLVVTVIRMVVVMCASCPDLAVVLLKQSKSNTACMYWL